jgi:hypothetical protein
MQPHQQRVVDEKAQNDDRLTKLSEFIKTSPIFQGLPMDEQNRLLKQSRLMAELSAVLGERIAAF